MRNAPQPVTRLLASGVARRGARGLRRQEQGQEGEAIASSSMGCIQCNAGWKGSKVAQRNVGLRKGTTTNRHGTKSSTTFCVFLLTGNSQTLILRIQIRGTWKRQADRVEELKRSVMTPPSQPGF